MPGSGIDALAFKNTASFRIDVRAFEKTSEPVVQIFVNTFGLGIVLRAFKTGLRL